MCFSSQHSSPHPQLPCIFFFFLFFGVLGLGGWTNRIKNPQNQMEDTGTKPSTTEEIMLITTPQAQGGLKLAQPNSWLHSIQAVLLRVCKSFTWSQTPRDTYFCGQLNKPGMLSTKACYFANRPGCEWSQFLSTWTGSKLEICILLDPIGYRAITKIFQLGFDCKPINTPAQCPTSMNKKIKALLANRIVLLRIQEQNRESGSAVGSPQNRVLYPWDSRNDEKTSIVVKFDHIF